MHLVGKDRDHKKLSGPRSPNASLWMDIAQRSLPLHRSKSLTARESMEFSRQTAAAPLALTLLKRRVTTESNDPLVGEGELCHVSNWR